MGVDVVGAEDFAGGLVGDGGFVFVDVDDDASPGMVSADSEVVKLAGATEGEFADSIQF